MRGGDGRGRVYETRPRSLEGRARRPLRDTWPQATAVPLYANERRPRAPLHPGPSASVRARWRAMPGVRARDVEG